MAEPLTPVQFQAETAVSRETLDRLTAFLDLLAQWQRRIDLVAPSTMRDPWRRHLLDSAQLAPLIPRGSRVADLGSGAGFPGLVLAILGSGTVHLIESDQRKAAFLREAVRITGAAASVHAVRAEHFTTDSVDVVTARALAPVARLLPLADRLLVSGGQALLLKGERVDAELTDAARDWTMRVERYPSRSDPRGTILRLTEIAHAGIVHAGITRAAPR